MPKQRTIEDICQKCNQPTTDGGIGGYSSKMINFFEEEKNVRKEF